MNVTNDYWITTDIKLEYIYLQIVVFWFDICSGLRIITFFFTFNAVPCIKINCFSGDDLRLFSSNIFWWSPKFLMFIEPLSVTAICEEYYKTEVIFKIKYQWLHTIQQEITLFRKTYKNRKILKKSFCITEKDLIENVDQMSNCWKIIIKRYRSLRWNLGNIL